MGFNSGFKGLMFLSRVPLYWTNVTTSTIKIMVTVVTINVNSITDIIVTNYIITDYLWVCSRYSDWLRAGRSGDRIPVGARFSAPVQTGPGAHSVSCSMGTGSFPGVKIGRGVMLTPHPLLVPWSRKGRAIPLLPLWAVRPVQSLSACTTVHFKGKGKVYHITCCESPEWE